MWRYLQGVENPKRKQTPEEKKAKDREYEKKRKRCFHDEWKEGRPWLRYDTDSHVMFCDYCMKGNMKGDKNVFIKGCSNFKMEAMKFHEKSQSHRYAANKHENEQNPSSAPAVKSLMSLDKALYSKLTVLFRTVHALNVQARPARDYIWQNELDVVKGTLEPGTKYSANEHNCVEFASAIADVPTQENKRKIINMQVLVSDCGWQHGLLYY